MQSKCISAVLCQNLIKHLPNIHQMYTTVSIGPSHTIFTRPLLPPSNGVSPNFTINLFVLLPPNFFHQETPSPLQKMHNISIGLGKPPYMLFFCFKQNSLFGASFFPQSGTPPQRYMQFQQTLVSLF